FQFGDGAMQLAPFGARVGFAFTLGLRLLRRASRENLIVARSIAVDCYALALERVSELVDRSHVLGSCGMREVGRLGDGRIAILLESGLHADVPLGSDVVRRDEDALPLLPHFVEVDVP